jgi:hypothetical protein
MRYVLDNVPSEEELSTFYVPANLMRRTGEVVAAIGRAIKNSTTIQVNAEELVESVIEDKNPASTFTVEDDDYKIAINNTVNGLQLVVYKKGTKLDWRLVR